MDVTCVFAALLFFIGNCLQIVYWLLEYEYRNRDFASFKSLDAEYIQDLWQFRRQWRAFEICAGLTNALAWFVFSIPIIQSAWILSLGGRRGISMHATIALLALGGCFTEFISRLFSIGTANVAEWLTTSMNLDTWVSENDNIGWRVLEVSHMITSGMILWVDAFEWLCMFGILTLLYFSTRSLMCSTEYRPSFSFGRCGAHLGLFIGLLSLIDFGANVLRFVSWRNFKYIAMFFSVLNRLILLPLWLCLFGKSLSDASMSREMTRLHEHPSDRMNGNAPVASFPPPGTNDDLPTSPGTNDDLATSPDGPIA